MGGSVFGGGSQPKAPPPPPPPPPPAPKPKQVRVDGPTNAPTVGEEGGQRKVGARRRKAQGATILDQDSSSSLLGS